MKYLKRNVDSELVENLESIGAVLIEGPRYCGKTTTARQLAKSEIRLNEPKEKANFAQMISVDPLLLLDGNTPRLIDEWQEFPQLWDAIRYEVDTRSKYGQFILTGSASPVDYSKISHSGVGRITKIRMWTMSLSESGESSSEVSLGELFAGDVVIRGKNPLSLSDIAFLICRGGWPSSVGEPDKMALKHAINYYNMLLESDISAVDSVSRNPDRVERVLRSYSRAICTQSKYKQIHRDIIANESSSLSEDTVYSYVEALKNLYVVSEIPTWNPNLRSNAAIRTTNTRNFVDPSVAAVSLRVTPDSLVKDIQTFGLLFESLCLRDLNIYAQSMGAKLYRYRDSNDMECDAVIETGDGRWCAIEIKLGSGEALDAAAKNLLKFESVVNTESMSSPAFLMALSGTASYAYRRPDGVYVVPIGCLKP